MSKNLKWSPDDLRKKGLVSNKAGDFVKVSSLVDKGKIDKLPLDNLLVSDKIKNELFNDLIIYGEAIAKTETDLFGNIITTHIEPPMPPLDPLSSDFILWVRTLTGKARDKAVMALKQAAEKMLAEADPECFFIRSNVASSKNSKEIGRFKKRNAKGELEEFATLIDSKVTTAYRKATAGQWLQNKIAFKNAVEGLKYPLNIEFTFIRDSLRKIDYHNTVQVLADLMTEYGWIPDDETAYLRPVFGNVYYHKQLCGVLIKIIK